MSSDISGVPKKVIKNASAILALPFQRLFNTSIETETFPDLYKELSAVCIHKRGSKQDKFNYRQIVNIDPISSAIEAVINKQLLEYLVENQFIPNQQYGFKPGKDVGTYACLKDAIADWIKNRENNKTTVITNFDISATFPTLDVDIVLKKVELLGVIEGTVNWFRSYLNFRVLQTRVGDAKSDKITTYNQVSEGSQFSSILFLI